MQKQFLYVKIWHQQFNKIDSGEMHVSHIKSELLYKESSNNLEMCEEINLAINSGTKQGCALLLCRIDVKGKH
jgi:hypothetical protein